MKTRTLSKRQGFLLQKFRNGIIESDAKYGACYRKKQIRNKILCVDFQHTPIYIMNAHTHMRAHASDIGTRIYFGFPFASKQWTFKTKRLIFPHMKKFLKFLQKLA